MPPASATRPIRPSSASTSRTRCPLPRPPIAGLQDIAKNDIEQVLDVGPPRQTAERSRGEPQLLGDQLFGPCDERASEHLEGMLQCNTMALARHDRELSGTEIGASKVRNRGDQSI